MSLDINLLIAQINNNCENKDSSSYVPWNIHNLNGNVYKHECLHDSTNKLCNSCSNYQSLLDKRSNKPQDNNNHLQVNISNIKTTIEQLKEDIRVIYRTLDE